MNYIAGTILELGEIKKRYVVLMNTKIDSNEDEILVVAPIEGDLIKPIIHNDKVIFLKDSSDGLEIINDIKKIVKVIENIRKN